MTRGEMNPGEDQQAARDARRALMSGMCLRCGARRASRVALLIRVICGESAVHILKMSYSDLFGLFVFSSDLMCETTKVQ